MYKVKAAVAVQRKLLEMTYTIFTTKNKYEKNYLKKTEQGCQQEEMAMV
jgi:hypothetical protein